MSDEAVASARWRRGDYAAGDYHRNPPQGWTYGPVYRRKLQWLDQILARIAADALVLDAGCGEGVTVENLRAGGRPRVWGADFNYGSQAVVPADIERLPFLSGRFDVVLALDVLEHLAYASQPAALHELNRVLADHGLLVLTVPNLAHLASRLKFLVKGELIRTARIEKHPGDRPIGEVLELLTGTGFEPRHRYGVGLTLPYLGIQFVQWPFALMPPALCFLNLIVATKVGSSGPTAVGPR